MNDYKIYPKQFQFDKIMIQKNKCFMIMPFDSEFDGIYGTIKDEFEKHQIICNRADEMNGSQPIVNKIINGILESQYIVVDITNAKPNVFYELGIAHSFRDARNILIIKQQSTNYPFDISHLPYYEYNSSNLYKLKSTIATFVNESQNITDFREALSINDIYDYTVNGSANYIEYVENYFKDDLKIYSQILNQKAAIYGEGRIEKALSDFETFITKNISSYNTIVLDGIFKIYIKLIAKCEIEKVVRKFALRFADNLLINGMENDALRLSKETDLMIALAENGRIMDLCLPWIIGYFSRSKSSIIDLNRYKLEKFLMSTNNTDIDIAIVNSLYNDDCHIREHMADIIGAKQIESGFQTLKKQLMVEENWFTIGSIIEAIGRVAPSEEGLDVIENWLDINGTRLLEEKQFFLLKHILHGIALLEKNGSEHTDKFLKTYKIYLHQNQVGPIN